MPPLIETEICSMNLVEWVFFYNSGQPGKKNSDATKQEIENDKAR